MRHIRIFLLNFLLITIATKCQCYNIGDSVFSSSDLIEFQKGGGKQYEAEQYSKQGEKGDKGYKAHHTVEEGNKGHHDKEDHKTQYAEQGGHKKGHNHQDGYYAQQHKGEKGRKGYHYEDHGSYAKGHSIKGHHNIHKLDEFKKDTEFYDEDHDAAHKEKHGGFEHKNQYANGGFHTGGHGKKVYLDGHFGHRGNFENGQYYFDDAGHKKAEGHDLHFKNAAKFNKEGGNDAFKKWGFASLLS